MTVREALSQAIGRAGLTTKKVVALKIMAQPTFSKKSREPTKFTLGELRKLNREVRFTDEEILTLVRGKER